METNLWCQINDFLFIWKGNWEQINDFWWWWGGGGGEKCENLFMRSNLLHQIKKFVYEIHFFGVYKQRNI